MEKIPLTARGAQALRDELTQLKSVERPKIVEAIAVARDHGDLKENAEYHAAREQQGFLEGRIQQIEGTLGAAQVIDPTAVNANGKVVFGATVTIEEIESGDEVTYQIVGDIEADIKKNLISIQSPIARALIGKEEGDEAVVKAPSGEREYEIVSVTYQ